MRRPPPRVPKTARLPSPVCRSRTSTPPSAPSGQYSVTLSSTHGALTLSTLTGLTFTAGDGAADASMTFTGTLSDINTALATASYAPDANYNGSATVDISVTDLVGGVVATGTGAATSDSDSVAVTITAVNDPVTSNAPATASGAEDSSIAITGLSIADVDATLAPSGQYSVTLSSTHGALTLSTLTGLTFTAGDGAADASMTFTGTLSDINTALATASYAPDANYNGSATVDISVTDLVGGVVATGTGAATSDSDSVAVTITAVNDPVTSNAPATASGAEDSSIAITGLSIADVDATLAPSGQYSVTLSSTHGALTLSTLTGLTFTAGDGAADASMTFTGTLSDINTALATASYAPDANYNGSATVDISVTDLVGGVVATGTGAATSDSDSVAVTITAVNDPVTSNAPATASGAEDSSIAITGLSIADVDATLAPSGQYSVTLSSTHGALTLSTLTGLTFTAGDGAADASMTFTGTLSDINTALATASYAPDANYNGSATVDISVTDLVGGVVATGTGAATSDSDSVAVTITAVNDPVTSNAPATASGAEDSSIAITGLSIADVDATLAPSGQYSVTLSSTHGALTLSTLTGLTFTAGDGAADASMTFTGTLSDINTALATASYAPDANYNGSATVDISVTDLVGGVVATGTGAATSDSDSVAVTITAVNDPVTSNAPATASGAEDSSIAITGLSIADVDATLGAQRAVFGHAVFDPRRADAEHAHGSDVHGRRRRRRRQHDLHRHAVGHQYRARHRQLRARCQLQRLGHGRHFSHRPRRRRGGDRHGRRHQRQRQRRGHHHRGQRSGHLECAGHRLGCRRQLDCHHRSVDRGRRRHPRAQRAVFGHAVFDPRRADAEHAHGSDVHGRRRRRRRQHDLHRHAVGHQHRARHRQLRARCQLQRLGHGRHFSHRPRRRRGGDRHGRRHQRQRQRRGHHHRGQRSGHLECAGHRLGCRRQLDCHHRSVDRGRRRHPRRPAGSIRSRCLRPTAR